MAADGIALLVAPETLMAYAQAVGERAGHEFGAWRAVADHGLPVGVGGGEHVASCVHCGASVSVFYCILTAENPLIDVITWQNVVGIGKPASAPCPGRVAGEPH